MKPTQILGALLTLLSGGLFPTELYGVVMSSRIMTGSNCSRVTMERRDNLLHVIQHPTLSPQVSDLLREQVEIGNMSIETRFEFSKNKLVFNPRGEDERIIKFPRAIDEVLSFPAYDLPFGKSALTSPSKIHFTGVKAGEDLFIYRSTNPFSSENSFTRIKEVKSVFVEQYSSFLDGTFIFRPSIIVVTDHGLQVYDLGLDGQIKFVQQIPYQAGDVKMSPIGYRGRMIIDRDWEEAALYSQAFILPNGRTVTLRPEADWPELIDVENLEGFEFLDGIH